MTGRRRRFPTGTCARPPGMARGRRASPSKRAGRALRNGSRNGETPRDQRGLKGGSDGTRTRGLRIDSCARRVPLSTAASFRNGFSAPSRHGEYPECRRVRDPPRDPCGDGVNRISRVPSVNDAIDAMQEPLDMGIGGTPRLWQHSAVQPDRGRDLDAGCVEWHRNRLLRRVGNLDVQVTPNRPTSSQSGNGRGREAPDLPSASAPAKERRASVRRRAEGTHRPLQPRRSRS